jgi:ariadne-1
MEKWQGRHHNCVQQKANEERNYDTNLRRFVDYNAKKETMNQAYKLDEQNFKHKMNICELELKEQWIKNEFVSLAVETLLQCRRTLMHSYIFSYLMCTIDNQMFLFEDNLKFLEQSTGDLSEILEHDVTAENVHHMKQKVVDGMSLCIKLRRDLIDHIKDGWENSWWRKFPIPTTELIRAEMAMGDIAIENLLF